MKYAERKFRIKGTDTLLGSSPANKEVFTEFLVG